MKREPGRLEWRIGGLVMIAAGLAGAIFCLRFVLQILDTGGLPGKYHGWVSAPSARFYVNVVAGLLGGLLGTLCAVIGWRWWRRSLD